MSEQSDQLKLANGRLGMEFVDVSTAKVDLNIPGGAWTLSSTNQQSTKTVVANQPITLVLSFTSNTGTVTVKVGTGVGGSQYASETYVASSTDSQQIRLTPTQTTLHVEVTVAAGSSIGAYAVNQDPVRYSHLQIVTAGQLSALTSDAPLLGTFTSRTLPQGMIIGGPFTGLTTDSTCQLIAYLDNGTDR